MIKRIIILSLPFMLSACSSNDEKKPEPLPQAPLTQSKNSEAFNKGFDKLLNGYYDLQAAFVKEDTILVGKATKAILMSADSLPIKELKSDTAIIETAKTYAMSISDEAKGLMGEKDINEKRKSFDMISNNILDLVRTVQYDRTKVYKIHCPMAFDNKGADWLSSSNKVVNPYLPKQMPDCGEVVDSIDYRK